MAIFLEISQDTNPEKIRVLQECVISTVNTRTHKNRFKKLEIKIF
jgi:hypothetical protein